MLRVEPRRERTSWESADGRFIFARYRDGWMPVAASKPDGSHVGDSRRLKEVGLMDIHNVPLAVFPRLSDAVAAIESVFTDAVDPPDLRLRQRSIGYYVVGYPILVSRRPIGWQLRPTDPTLEYRLCEGLFGSDRAAARERLRRHWTHSYPTRSAALEALAEWLRAHGLVEETVAG